MTPEAIFLTVGAAYLAIIAYGVVRTRQKGLPLQIRFAAASAQVILPPVILFGALLMTRDAFLIGGWGVMLGMLLIAGALLALCTDIVAKRVL